MQICIICVQVSGASFVCMRSYMPSELSQNDTGSPALSCQVPAASGAATPLAPTPLAPTPLAPTPLVPTPLAPTPLAPPEGARRGRASRV